jgi:hypothetical protein
MGSRASRCVATAMPVIRRKSRGHGGGRAISSRSNPSKRTEMGAGLVMQASQQHGNAGEFGPMRRRIRQHQPNFTSEDIPVHAGCLP